MPTSIYYAQVQCPFYHYDNISDNNRFYRIVCEGFVDNSNLVQTYKVRKDFEQQLRIFCCEHYKKCEVYRMLMEKYQDAA